MAATTASARKFLPKSILNTRKEVSSSTLGPSNPFTQRRIEISMFSVTRCTQCVAPLPEQYPYKWCEPCRAKDRDKAKRKKERRKARLADEQNQDSIRLRALGTQDRAEGSSTRASSSSATTVPQKRKVDVVDTPVKTPLSVRPRMVKSRKRSEFQTQDRLFDALAARIQALQDELEEADPSSTSSSSYLNFWGGYTIVLDPDVPLKERVEMVVSELKERTSLPLGLVIKRVDGCTATGYIQRHWCTCMGLAPPPKVVPAAAAPSPAAQSTASVKRSGSMLMSWLAGGSKSKSEGRAVDGGLQEDPSARPGRGVCGGTISVHAVVDSSHPLADKGMKGQRVSVQVEHPGRYV